MAKEGGMPENLINWKDVDEETKKEWRRKGAQRSNEVQREKKKMREVMTSLLSMPIKDGPVLDLDEITSFTDLKDKNVTVMTLTCIKQIERASKGNTRAAEFIRDTIGEMPINNVNIEGGGVPIIIHDDIDAK